MMGIGVFGDVILAIVWLRRSLASPGNDSAWKKLVRGVRLELDSARRSTIGVLLPL